VTTRSTGTSREDAAELDRTDPIAWLRDEFVIEDDVIYLDGNSLGRLPRRTAETLATFIRDDWGRSLVTGWDRWLDWPRTVGDQLAREFLGARDGEVVVADSTSVNLFRLAAAALGARSDRRWILVAAEEFPTDRYILEGLAAERGLEVRFMASDPVDGLGPTRLAEALRQAEPDGGVALVLLSHVNYRSGALEPMAELTRLTHEAGALILWDCSHSIGSVPIELDASGADLAVGCTYKYMNAGPGSPAFLHVRRSLQPELRQPIWGWFAQREQFAMGPRFDPVDDIGRFLVGTPPVAGLVAVRESATLLAGAGIDALRAKGIALTELAAGLADVWLAPLGFDVGSPRDPARRGSHVSLRHTHAWQISQAARSAGVVGDFRAPDSLRLGFVPAYTRFIDAWDALDRIRSIVATEDHLRYGSSPGRVT
jgi:kynureninase